MEPFPLLTARNRRKAAISMEEKEKQKNKYWAPRHILYIRT